jgi:type IV secretory pathway TraG/TraD family ATPase VirD4
VSSRDRDRSGQTGVEVLLGVLAGVAAVVGGAGLVAEAGIAAASLLFGDGWVFLPVSEVPHLIATMFTHSDQLALAYPAGQRHDLAGNGTLWACIVVALIAYAAVVVLLLVLLVPLLISRPGYEKPTRASRLLGVSAVRRATRRLHPELVRKGEQVPIGGPRLGRMRGAGLPLHASIEDSVLLVGPPGAGKGTGFMYRAVADAVGAVVSTSTKPDVLLNTVALRQRDGLHGPRKVWVFDPQEISGWPSVLRWSPTRGCEDPTTAIVRAAGMAEASQVGKGVTNGDFWAGQTAAVIRCYLHAAALGNKTALDVMRWARNPKAEEPITILNEHPGAADGWGDELAEQKAAPANQVGSVWAGVRRAFDSLADPRVARACSPQPGEGFSPEEFIENGDTLYLLGSNKATLSVAPLVVALIEDIVEAGRRLAADSPGERMALPLTLALDEVANIAPLPSLPYVLGDGRGQGFQTHVVFQSLAQARSRWGAEEAEVIWDTCTCRMILPGSANQRDNKMISELLGEFDEVGLRKSRGRGATSYNEDIRSRSTMTVNGVREIKPGRFLLIYRHLKPIEGELELSYKGRDAKRFTEAIAEGRRLTGRRDATPSDPPDDQSNPRPRRGFRRRRSAAPGSA